MIPYLRMFLESTGSWREAVASEMLTAEAIGGSGEYALLKKPPPAPAGCPHAQGLYSGLRTLRVVFAR